MRQQQMKLNEQNEEALVFYSEKRSPPLLLRTPLRARLLAFLGFSRAFEREVLLFSLRLLTASRLLLPCIFLRILFSVALVAIIHRRMKKEMAIIITKIQPNIAMDQIWSLIIFNLPCLFMANHCKPSIGMWRILLYFFSLLATETFQNHFIYEFFNFQLLFFDS